MNKSTITLILGPLVLLIFTCAPLYAQTTAVIRADIPFDFMIGDQVLPTGTYTARPLVGTSILQIRHAENSEVTAVGTTPVENGVLKNAKSMFVFRRYGNQYFLVRVWAGHRGCELPMSAKERQVAKGQPKPELIMVAAK